LRVLGELRRRHRIAGVSAPEQPQKNLQDLVEALRAIYGLRGQHWDERIANPPRTPAATQQWVEHLGLLVEETENREPKIAAAATLLASLLLNEPLDPETTGEVKKLLLVPEGTDLDVLTNE
jgi:hypothetical protein